MRVELLNDLGAEGCAKWKEAVEIWTHALCGRELTGSDKAYASLYFQQAIELYHKLKGEPTVQPSLSARELVRKIREYLIEEYDDDCPNVLFQTEADEAASLIDQAIEDAARPYKEAVAKMRAIPLNQKLKWEIEPAILHEIRKGCDLSCDLEDIHDVILATLDRLGLRALLTQKEKSE